jgi:hypothetical protein
MATRNVINALQKVARGWAGARNIDMRPRCVK